MSNANPLNGISERLNGTVSKVSKLRLILDDLEIELNEIRQQCENQIHARTTKKALVDQDRHQKDKNLEEKRIDRRTASSKTEPKRNPSTVKVESKGQATNSPTPSSPGIPGGSGSSPRSVAKDGDRLRPLVLRAQSRTTPIRVKGGRTLVTVRKYAEKFPIRNQIRFQRPPPPPPRPPIDPFSFPEDIDLTSYPPELKREGPDWFVLFNPSPKIKRVLDASLVHTLDHDFRVHCVRFSQDGKWLAMGCWRTAQIYEVETGLKTCILEHTNTSIFSVCFSPDGKYLATGAGDKRIRVWNIEKKQIHNIFEGTQIVYSVHFSSNGQFIVFGSGNRSVCIQDVHDGTLKVLTTDDHYFPHDQNYEISPVAISSDGRYVAGGNANKVVDIWELATGYLVQRLTGHRDGVSCVAFTPDGKGLITGSYDKILKYWDIGGLGVGSDVGDSSRTSSSPCLMNLTGHEDQVHSTAVSSDGTWIVSGSSDRNVLFRDMRTGGVQCMLSGHKSGVTQVDMSPLGNFLATANFGRQVRIWRYDLLDRTSF